MQVVRISSPPTHHCHHQTYPLARIVIYRSQTNAISSSTSPSSLPKKSTFTPYSFWWNRPKHSPRRSFRSPACKWSYPGSRCAWEHRLDNCHRGSKFRGEVEDCAWRANLQACRARSKGRDECIRRVLLFLPENDLIWSGLEESTCRLVFVKSGEVAVGIIGGGIVLVNVNKYDCPWKKWESSTPDQYKKRYSLTTETDHSAAALLHYITLLQRQLSRAEHTPSSH